MTTTDIDMRDQGGDTNESFTVSSEEAAHILGVNRSRLSQLTGKGVFTFERRKIEARNRLSYKLSELLGHQRSQMYGNTNTSVSAHHFKTEERNEPATFIETKEATQEKIIIPFSYPKTNLAYKKEKLSARQVNCIEIERKLKEKNQQEICLIMDILKKHKEILIKIQHINSKKEHFFQQELQKIKQALQAKVSNVLELQENKALSCNASSNSFKWKKRKRAQF